MINPLPSVTRVLPHPRPPPQRPRPAQRTARLRDPLYVLKASYKYDFAGRQAIRSLSGGITIHSVFDSQGNRIAEYNEATGALIREYVWFNGAPLAVIEGGVTTFIRTDHIGRPVFGTNTGGTKVWTASYLPFGGVRTTTGTPITARNPWRLPVIRPKRALAGKVRRLARSGGWQGQAAGKLRSKIAVSMSCNAASEKSRIALIRPVMIRSARPCAIAQTAVTSCGKVPPTRLTCVIKCAIAASAAVPKAAFA